MEEKDFLVEKVGKCVVITMDLGENRLNPNFIRAMNKALDQAEKYEDATCLVTTGVGKCYSLGLDLEWIAAQSPSELLKVSNDLQKLLARLLTFPMVTVAALNGHTYAGGCMIAITHDYLIMRNQRGWFCFSEVKINRNFPVSFFNVIRSRLPHASQHQAIVIGKRYTAEEALEAKIVSKVCTVEKLKQTAIETALQLAGKDGLRSLAAIKHDMYRDSYLSLMEPIKYHSNL